MAPPFKSLDSGFENLQKMAVDLGDSLSAVPKNLDDVLDAARASLYPTSRPSMRG